MDMRPLRSSGIRLNDICKERDKPQMWKTQMKRPQEINALLKKRNVPRSVYYFTTGRKLHESRARDIFNENPYSYPSDDVRPTHAMYAKLLGRQERTRVLNKRSGYSRPTIESSNYIDIPERLHMPEGKTIPAITDEAPRFFRSVEGRPVKEKFCKSKYISDLRKAFYANYKASVIQTRMFQEDQNMEKKLKDLEECRNLHEVIFKSYHSFLWTDHTSAQEALSSMEAHKEHSKELWEELVVVSAKHRKLELEMYVLEEKWRHYKVLEGFLCRISPYSWRREYDYIYLKRENGRFVQWREFSEVRKRYRLASCGTVASLDSLLDLYVEDTETQQLPSLCLTELSEIQAAFRKLEFMNMNLAVENEMLYEPLNSVLKTVTAVEMSYDFEIKRLQNQIEYFTKAIIWKKVKIAENKVLVSKELHGPMTKLLCLPNLYMHLYWELTYMVTVSKYNPDQPLIKLGEAVTKRYNIVMKSIERLNGRLVAETERKHYAQKLRQMKKTTRAQQLYRRGERIIYRSNVAFAPKFIKQGRKLVERSTPAEDARPPRRPPLILTDEQKEYLTYFTDYYAPTDDVRKYLPNL